jgi:hypothetical protein
MTKRWAIRLATDSPLSAANAATYTIPATLGALVGCGHQPRWFNAALRKGKTERPLLIR